VLVIGRRHLLADRKVSPATAKLALVAIDSFYAWLGLGTPDVDRVVVGRRRTAPRALNEDQQRRLLRAAEGDLRRRGRAPADGPGPGRGYRR
jgi:integrase